MTTNPALFYYNLFHFGSPGSELQLSADIPYPFVTLGEYPIQMYQNLTLEGDEKRRACLVHADPEDKILEGSQQVSWDEYHRNYIGDKKSIEISAVFPSSGFIHVAVLVGFGTYALCVF